MAMELDGTENEAITSVDDIQNKADAAIAVIDADLATLGGSPTNGEVIAILVRTLRNQKKIIRVLRKVLG